MASPIIPKVRFFRVNFRYEANKEFVIFKSKL